MQARFGRGPIEQLVQLLVQNIDDRLLLPLPLTPVTQTNLPSGKATSIFFRLFSRAPRTTISRPLPTGAPAARQSASRRADIWR